MGIIRTILVKKLLFYIITSKILINSFSFTLSMDKSLNDIAWKQIKENVVFQNKYLTLQNDLVERPDEAQINFLKIKTTDYATVFCITNENKVVLVKQYRYAFESFSWECPGGILEDGEKADESAKREVLEETGYRVLSIKQVLKSHPNAYSTAWAYTFLATVEKFGEQNLDDNEFISVKEFDLQTIPELINKGEMIHNPSLTCWFMAQLHNGYLI